MASFSRTSISAVLLLIVAGCGQRDWGYLSGTVRLNGQPVGPGTIMLEPQGERRAGGVAYFGEDGKYKVISAGRKEGARTGEYRVLIHGGTPEETAGEHVGPPPESKIPRRYGNPNTTDLTVTIERGRKTVDFDLMP